MSKQLATNLDEERRRLEEALAAFVRRLADDRNILAAVLVGSISEDTIWWKESLGLWIIEADGVSKRLKADGNDERIHRILVEEGVNIHAQVIPRSRFRRMVEGSSRTAFSCSFFALRQLVHCVDPSIQSWFEQANTAATKDQEKELLAVTTWAIYAERHARKLLDIRQDLDLCTQTTLWAAQAVAAMEIVRFGQVYEKEAIYRAIEIRPELFQTIYLDVISKRRTKKLLRTALDAINGYLEESWRANLKPLIHYLSKRGGVVALTEISDHFACTQLYPWHLESSCEWLEKKGLVEKVSVPFKLTTKSRVDVEEPAYMLID